MPQMKLDTGLRRYDWGWEFVRGL